MSLDYVLQTTFTVVVCGVVLVLSSHNSLAILLSVQIQFPAGGKKETTQSQQQLLLPFLLSDNQIGRASDSASVQLKLSCVVLIGHLHGGRIRDIELDSSC